MFGWGLEGVGKMDEGGDVKPWVAAVGVIDGWEGIPRGKGIPLCFATLVRPQPWHLLEFGQWHYLFRENS